MGNPDYQLFACLVGRRAFKMGCFSSGKRTLLIRQVIPCSPFGFDLSIRFAGVKGLFPFVCSFERRSFGVEAVLSKMPWGCVANRT